MVCLAVDDEKIALEMLVEAIKQASPEANIQPFSYSEDVLEYAAENPVDIAFLDIRLGGTDGITLARQLKHYHPKINIIFATSYAEYSGAAFDLFASGYLLKPITSDAVARQLENLRHPITRRYKMRAVTCGAFEFYVDGIPLSFKRHGSKEILACLIDGWGKEFTRRELAQKIFVSEKYDDRVKENINNCIKAMVATLKEAGAEKILRRSWGNYSIDPTKFSCDLYDYMDSLPSADAISGFNGEYMTGYPWAQETLKKLYGEDE